MTFYTDCTSTLFWFVRTEPVSRRSPVDLLFDHSSSNGYWTTLASFLTVGETLSRCCLFACSASLVSAKALGSNTTALNAEAVEC